MPRGGGAASAERARARAAERRAFAAKEEAHRIAMRVSPDRDLEGSVAQCAGDAEHAWRQCGRAVRLCDEAARVDRYADRYERKDAAEDARRYAARAEQHAEAAELAAQGAAWAEQRLLSEDRELARSGAQFGPTFRGWMSRGRAR
jgi:hypothetical protein